MPEITETGRGTGGIQGRPDPRDYDWSEIGFGSPPFDWTVGFDIEKELHATLIPKDQGKSLSCGGFAWAYEGEVLEAVSTGTYEQRSPKFIYAQTFQPGGGSTGRDNAAVFVSQGVAREVQTPSQEQNMPPSEAFMRRVTDISDGARFDATLDKSLSYANVNVTLGINSIAQAMRDNFGVILGIAGQNNGTWTSAFPAPPTTQEWAHWIYAGKAKIINGKKYIGCLNSWGSSIGERGWQWLSEDYINKILPNGYGRAVWQVWSHILAPIVLPPFSHNFTKTINYGDTGPEVTALQRALQLDGEFPKVVPCSGNYLDITRVSVLAFQLKYSLAPLAELFTLNGKTVGPKTRTKLNSLFNT